MIFFHSQRRQPVIYYLSLLFSGVGRSPHPKLEVGEWNTLFEEWEIAARSKEIDGGAGAGQHTIGTSSYLKDETAEKKLRRKGGINVKYISSLTRSSIIYFSFSISVIVRMAMNSPWVGNGTHFKGSSNNKPSQIN